MADITETAIAAIHTKIDAELSPDTLPYKIGAKYIRQKATNPRVVWAEADTVFEPAKRAGGNPAEIAVDASAWDVHIWHTSRENARTTMHNILAAARQVNYGSSWFRAKGYKPMQDASMALTAKGEGFVMRVEILIAVPEYIQSTVVVTTFEGDAIAELPAGDETVATLDYP